MKAGFLVFLALAGTLLAGDPETFDPPVSTVERYQHIWEKSPFVPEAPPVVQDPKSGLAQRFVLTGMATLNDEPILFVLDRQSLTRLVVSRKYKPQGLELISVESNADPKQSSATIRLGAEQGVIRYDLAALQSVNQAAENKEAKNNSAANTAVSATGVSPSGAPPLPSANPAGPNANGAPPRPTRVIKRTISLKTP